jgi:hypothetical protein
MTVHYQRSASELQPRARSPSEHALSIERRQHDRPVALRHQAPRHVVGAALHTAAILGRKPVATGEGDAKRPSAGGPTGSVPGGRLCRISERIFKRGHGVSNRFNWKWLPDNIADFSASSPKTSDIIHLCVSANIRTNGRRFCAEFRRIS